MERIFDWFKYHKKMVITLSIIIYMIIPMLLFLESPIGFLKKDDAIIILEYYATIISGITGGFLTLSGVWWTIRDQANKKIIESHEQHKPFLKVSTVKPTTSFSNSVPKLFKMYISYITDENNDTIVTPNQIAFIKLENIGLGIAKNIQFKLDNVSFQDNDTFEQFFEYTLNIETLFDNPYIMNNDYEIIPILFRYNVSNKNQKEILNKKILATNLLVNGAITFSDLFDNEYSQKLNFQMALNYKHGYFQNFYADILYLYLENIE